MDPNATLAELREMIRQLDRSLADMPCECEQSSMASDIADKFTGLDHWLSTGGFKPSDWS